MLEEALSNPNLSVLLWTALSLGFIHTALGPDHYIPFAMMAKAQKWTKKKTFWITLLCGLGHVGSSILIASILVFFGRSLGNWGGTSLARFQEIRGSVAAWALIGFGAAYGVWGLRRAYRGKSHDHVHVHENGTRHAHSHSHELPHAHVHAEGKKITPWILFAVFVFGPCESLIPLILAAWALGGMGTAIWVGSAFAISTLFTILLAVGALLSGFSLLPMQNFDRYSHAAAGASLCLCGVAIQFLGL